jgi:UDP-N-acetylglucosamine--N-acetylmuramyl-(pentapeptide) pyrophosphoryl-undecaprenol N-acetylglucosamine transferase
MVWGFIKTLIWLTRYKPTKVITTGGLLALPVGYAAWVLRYPLDLYELNVVPGRAVEALAPLATNIYAVFKATQQYLPSCKQIPYPLRFTEQDRVSDHTSLIQHLNDMLRVSQSNELLFDPSRKTLMILGGSQGSQLLNRLTRQFCMDHKHLLHNLQVIHQTGAFEEHWWRDFYKSVNVPAYTFSYNQRINECYQLADLIVCRAGAGTLFETVFFNKPCIVIPLVADTTDHQVNNAQEIAGMHPDLVTVFQQESVMLGQHKLFAAIAERLQPR